MGSSPESVALHAEAAGRAGSSFGAVRIAPRISVLDLCVMLPEEAWKREGRHTCTKQQQQPGPHAGSSTGDMQIVRRIQGTGGLWGILGTTQPDISERGLNRRPPYKSRERSYSIARKIMASTRSGPGRIPAAGLTDHLAVSRLTRWRDWCRWTPYRLHSMRRKGMHPTHE